MAEEILWITGSVDWRARVGGAYTLDSALGTLVVVNGRTMSNGKFKKA